MSRVETFVSKINSAVHIRQEQEKVLSVLAKLETYTPVEPVNEEAEKVIYRGNFEQKNAGMLSFNNLWMIYQSICIEMIFILKCSYLYTASVA